eukprot:502877-Prymnesium_polylepis.1
MNTFNQALQVMLSLCASVTQEPLFCSAKRCLRAHLNMMVACGPCASLTRLKGPTLPPLSACSCVNLAPARLRGCVQQSLAGCGYAFESMVTPRMH